MAEGTEDGRVGQFRRTGNAQQFAGNDHRFFISECHDLARSYRTEGRLKSRRAHDSRNNNIHFAC